MIINLKEFEDVIRRATINFLVDFVQLNVTKDRIKAKMTNGRGSISILDMPNNMIFEMKLGDELQLNFDDPQASVLPYLATLGDVEDALFDEKREKVVLKAGKINTKISLAFPQDNKIFLPDAPKSSITPFTTFDIDSDFMEAYSKMKKVASKFEKVYFTVEDGKLYLETTDKTNTASNGVRVDLFEVEGEDPKVICFPFKNVSNIISLANDDQFTMSLTYVKDQQMGMMTVARKDSTENYYQFSLKE